MNLAQRLAAVPIYALMAPEEGPKAVPNPLTFVTAGTLSGDLLIEESNKVISFVQAVYIDNPTAYQFTLQINGTQQIIRVPPLTQGFYTALASDQLYYNATLGGAGVINLQWLNVPIAPDVWSSTTPMPVANTVIVADATDRGGTITAANTSQQFMAANSNRRGFEFQNQSGSVMYINDKGAATADYHSLMIPAGGSYYISSDSRVSPNAYTVICATVGAPFYAREY